jgi:phosphoglycolate phosphatase
MVVGAADVENHKPHPESVHMTLEQLSIPLDHAVVIGDSIFDLDMAKNAGVDAIGVTTGLHSKEMLAKSEPTHIVDGLHARSLAHNSQRAQRQQAGLEASTKL